MSELKAYTFSAMERTGLADYYLKSEVDKVFRRLKTRLAHKGISNQRLEADKNHNWSKYCTAMTELRHQKYKRCLAMAKLAIKDDYLPWNMKWHNRWLELAEKFKPNKSTDQ